MKNLTANLTLEVGLVLLLVGGLIQAWPRPHGEIWLQEHLLLLNVPLMWSPNRQLKKGDRKENSDEVKDI